MDIKISHMEVRGVIQSMWHFVHLTGTEGGLEKNAIMMAPRFSHPLQTALDDT